MYVSTLTHAHIGARPVGMFAGMGVMGAMIGSGRTSGWHAGTGPAGVNLGGPAVSRVMQEPGKAACGAASTVKGGEDGAEPFFMEGCGCGGGSGCGDEGAAAGPPGSAEPKGGLAGPAAVASAPPGQGSFSQNFDDEPPISAGPGTGIIWLTAGPPSCTPQDPSECALYAVLWSFDTDKGWVYPQENETVWGMGVAQPAINAGGRYVAYVMNLTAAGSTAWSALAVRDNRSSTRYVDTASGGTLLPQFPNFYSSGRLLFHRASQLDGVTMGTLYSVEGNAGYTSLSTEAHLGPDGAAWPERGFQDANTHAGPAYAGAVPGERMIVSHGRKTVGAEVNPQVHTLDGSTMQEFRVDDEHRSCQHPAWNVTGDRILCTMHEPTARASGRSHRLLFGYRWDGSEWGAEGSPLVAAIEPARVPGMAAAEDAGGCELVTYKYGEFCLSDDYVVFTMYCSTGGAITASRVMLVRLSDQARWDITERVEGHMGVDPGSWQGVYSTCSRTGVDS